MSTRRVKAGEQRRQNGWASAPEYDVLRGLNGTAVAFKAALQDDPKARELLYALQSLSLREGGLKRIGRELVEMFPERIGTPTMHAIGCKPGKRLTREQCRAIHQELFPEYSDWSASVLVDVGSDCTAELLSRDEPEPEPIYLRTAEQFEQDCLAEAEGIHRFIEDLCCNPKMEVSRKGDMKQSYRRRIELILEDAREVLAGDSKLARERPHLQTAIEDQKTFGAAEVPYFHDVLGALYEYQRRLVERVRADFVETSISRIVFEAFDYVLETGRSALVEGSSGFGKTTALKACCEMNPGRVRYVQLSGITSRTAFIKRIADACGVANGGGMSTDRIQARVEAFLKRTKLALIIDEGQYLWPQGKRITSHPELVNWLNTSLYNEGVPFLISATRQFTLRRQAIEKQTDWSSEQSRRRTRKVFPLPDAPTTPDLQAVARKLLASVGDAGEPAVDYVVGYALTARGYFQAVADTIDDARLIAKRAGRDRVTFKDVKAAIHEWRAPSDAALQRVFDSKPEKPKKHSMTHAAASLPTEGSNGVEGSYSGPSNGHARPLQAPFSGVQSGRRETQPAAIPALTG